MGANMGCGYYSTPTFIAKTAFTGTSTNTGFNIATPSGVAIGDYLFLSLVTNKDTITPDAKFTLIQQDLDSANPWSMALYSRIATAADVAGDTYTWACSGTTNAGNTAVLMAYRDVDSTNVLIGKTYTSGTTNPVSTPNVSTNGPSLILTGNGARISSGGIATFTGSGNERHDGGNVGVVSYQQAWYDSGSIALLHTSQGANSITSSTATNLTDRMSYTIALHAQFISTPPLTQPIQRASRW